MKKRYCWGGSLGRGGAMERVTEGEDDQGALLTEDGRGVMECNREVKVPKIYCMNMWNFHMNPSDTTNKL
jgi:hypothetical protein